MTSAQTAQALAILGFRVTHVGEQGEDIPPLGAPDEVVLAHAKSRNKVILTNNYDLLLLCAEQGESVIWLDPRGPDLRLTQIVVRCFENIEEWESLFAQANGAVCVRSMKTKNDVLGLDRAARVAERRMAQQRRRTRAAARRRGTTP